MDNHKDWSKGMSKKEKKKGRMGGIIRNLVLIIAAAVFLFSAYQLVMIYLEYKKGTDEYDKIRQYAVESPVKEETKEKAVQKKTTHTKTPIIGVAPHVMNVAKDGQAPYVPVANPVQHDKKIYPNDPCPCGSGKKYKKCCGKRA